MDIEKAINGIFPKETDIPDRFKLNDTVQQTQYLVNGEFRTWDGPTQDVLSPVCLQQKNRASQKMLGRYPLLKENESKEVLDAAVKAYGHGRGVWSTMSVEDRIKHIEEFAYRMKEKKEQVVKLLMWEIGKSFADSEKEFDRTVDYIRDTILALKDLDRVSSRFVIEQGIIGQIRRAPLGVVLCMGPYNYPLNETFTTLIPALIMGNAVIFKPPRLGVLLHWPLLDAFRASFPPGVVNTVYGEGQKVISPLMKSGKIDALAFIGSSRVADILKKDHPNPHRLRCVFGLEAKNAAVILADADLDLTIKESITGALSYNGQRCTALKMIFVHKKIVDTYLERFIAAVEKLKCSMPWEKNVGITPLPELGRVEYLTDIVKDARQLGGKIVNKSGGKTNGTFFYPAIVYPVNSRMRLYAEEQFGPVVAIAPFEDIEEPIRYIIASNYGQQMSIFGSDPNMIADLIDPLVNQVCRVNINSQCQRGPDTFPFTGRKDSAEGTLSVSDALRVFSIRTLVAAKEASINKAIITKIVRERKSNFLNTDYIF
jgi:glyceraldehyde-3-phosphate dehydrogenase (NADP+)